MLDFFPSTRDSSEPRDLDVLREARRYIDAGWAIGAEARNRYGESISPQDVNAIRFCMIGAVRRAAGGNTVLSRQVLRLMRRRVGVWVLHRWNDSHRKSDVLAAFDSAIRHRMRQIEIEGGVHV